MYLVLPTVSTTVFGVFPCDEITDEEDYLRADYSISCKDEGRGEMMAFGYVCLRLYPISIPLAFARLLWGSKDRIKRGVAERNTDEDLQVRRVKRAVCAWQVWPSRATHTCANMGGCCVWQDWLDAQF